MDPVSPGQIPALARWARDGTRWVAARVKPDHNSIRQLWLRPNQFAMVRHFVYAAVAPSRRCARAWDDQSVRRAMAFADRATPGTFSAEPQISDGYKSLFYTQTSDGTRERELAVYRTGLVELLWSVPLRRAPDEQLLLPATAVVGPLLGLADAVATREYAELSGLHHRRRHFVKVDWSFMMTCAASPNGVRETWSAIELPDPRPPRAGAQHGGEFPAHGTGRLSLRRSAGRDAISGFLTELLVANGYHELGDVCTLTLAAADLGPEGRRSA
jgi:hypothetical protein